MSINNDLNKFHRIKLYPFLQIQSILPALLLGPKIYKNEGNTTIDVKNDETIVVINRIPNLFSMATLHITRKNPEKHDVSAPPSMVEPI